MKLHVIVPKLWRRILRAEWRRKKKQWVEKCCGNWRCFCYFFVFISWWLVFLLLGNYLMKFDSFWERFSSQRGSLKSSKATDSFLRRFYPAVCLSWRRGEMQNQNENRLPKSFHRGCLDKNRRFRIIMGNYIHRYYEMRVTSRSVLSDNWSPF